MARRGLGRMVAPAGSREDVFELGPIPVGPLAWWIGTVAAKASGSNKALIPILVVVAVAAVAAGAWYLVSAGGSDSPAGVSAERSAPDPAAPKAEPVSKEKKRGEARTRERSDSGDEADRGKSRRERAKAGTIGGGDSDKKDTKKRSSPTKSRRKKKGSKDEAKPKPEKPSATYTEPGVG